MTAFEADCSDSVRSSFFPSYSGVLGPKQTSLPLSLTNPKRRLSKADHKTVLTTKQFWLHCRHTTCLMSAVYYLAVMGTSWKKSIALQSPTKFSKVLYPLQRFSSAIIHYSYTVEHKKIQTEYLKNSKIQT
jgi:hypothetical protein